MPNARRPKPRVQKRRRRRANNFGIRTAKFLSPRPRTQEDFDRILAAEGMPAEIARIPTKFTCSPAPPGHPRRARHPQLQNAIDQMHVDRAAAEGWMEMATEILWRGGLCRLERRVWMHVCEGRGWPAIKTATGLTKHRIVTVIARVCARFALAPPS